MNKLERSGFSNSTPPVLCVDLDGTLIRNDVSIRSFVLFLAENPLRLFPALLWLRHGRAHLKRKIAERVKLDPSSLDYRIELLDFLRKEKSNGRRLILATASDQTYADVISSYVGLFDEAIGSNGKFNLSRHRKRAALEKRYGRFSYMGNSRDDLEVWCGAEEVFAVSVPATVLNKLKALRLPKKIFH